MRKLNKKGSTVAPSNGSLAADRKKVTIFMPAPIDRDFVPYPRRPMLRRNMRLIDPLHPMILSHIFPYVMSVFGNSHRIGHPL